MDKKDIVMISLVAVLFFGALWFTRDTIPDPEPVPETVEPYMSVRDQFMQDVEKLPDPIVREETETTYWRNTDIYTPNELIPLSDADQTSLYYICKANNVPMSYALAIIESESNFNSEAVGSSGEVGVFQIHPVNWDRMADNEIDVHCMTGNLEAGVLMLREALDMYMEMDKATMVYKCGPGRAKELIDQGVRLGICDEVSSLAMFYEELLNEAKG
jgi:hypothetical protein